MNTKIIELKYCPKKGSPFVDVDSLKIDELGIPSDCHYGDKNPISIFLENHGEEHEKGFCSGKFFPNVVIGATIDKLEDTSAEDNNQVKAVEIIKPNQRIQIGDALLQITKIKECHKDCPVRDKLNCLYNSTCCFAKVISGRKIKIGDSVSIL